MQDDVRSLAESYVKALQEKGVTPEGVLWPSAGDLANRFDVLLGICEPQGNAASRPLKLLDLGCGPGFLLDYLSVNGQLDRVEYTGVDVAEVMVEHARGRWPGKAFEIRDIREQPFPNDAFDVCIACGVFTARFSNSYEAMENFAKVTLKALWPSVRTGLSFNVMSKHVDWERDDLFHWPLDDMMAFCKAELSRNVRVRLDYGLWETSVFVLKQPTLGQHVVPHSWSRGPR